MTPVPLIAVSGIARRLGMSRQRVHVLAHRDDFPTPLYEIATGRLWREADIERWIRAHPHYDHSAPEGEA